MNGWSAMLIWARLYSDKSSIYLLCINVIMSMWYMYRHMANINVAMVNDRVQLSPKIEMYNDCIWGSCSCDQLSTLQVTVCHCANRASFVWSCCCEIWQPFMWWCASVPASFLGKT